MNLKDKVKALVDSELSQQESLFLADLSVGADNSIRITIDGDNGVGIDDCIQLSRAVEGVLDREEVDFSLEVTSFGATEPFVMARQYAKNAGRTVQVTTTDGHVHEGTLKGIAEEQVVIEVESREPKPVGKGKHTVRRALSFPLSDIKETKVIIKF